MWILTSIKRPSLFKDHFFLAQTWSLNAGCTVRAVSDQSSPESATVKPALSDHVWANKKKWSLNRGGEKGGGRESAWEGRRKGREGGKEGKEERRARNGETTSDSGFYAHMEEWEGRRKGGEILVH